MKNCWNDTHSHDIQDVDVWSEEILRNLALHHLLTNGSSAVNGCRQNESPNSWFKQHNTSQNNITKVLWSEKLCLCNKKNPSLSSF